MGSNPGKLSMFHQKKNKHKKICTCSYLYPAQTYYRTLPSSLSSRSLDQQSQLNYGSLKRRKVHMQAELANLLDNNSSKDKLTFTSCVTKVQHKSYEDLNQSQKSNPFSNLIKVWYFTLGTLFMSMLIYQSG